MEIPLDQETTAQPCAPKSDPETGKVGGRGAPRPLTRGPLPYRDERLIFQRESGSTGLAHAPRGAGLGGFLAIAAM